MQNIDGTGTFSPRDESEFINTLVTRLGRSLSKEEVTYVHSLGLFESNHKAGRKLIERRAESIDELCEFFHSLDSLNGLSRNATRRIKNSQDTRFTFFKKYKPPVKGNKDAVDEPKNPISSKGQKKEEPRELEEPMREWRITDRVSVHYSDSYSLLDEQGRKFAGLDTIQDGSEPKSLDYETDKESMRRRSHKKWEHTNDKKESKSQSVVAATLHRIIREGAFDDSSLSRVLELINPKKEQILFHGRSPMEKLRMLIEEACTQGKLLAGEKQILLSRSNRKSYISSPEIMIEGIITGVIYRIRTDSGTIEAPKERVLELLLSNGFEKRRLSTVEVAFANSNGTLQFRKFSNILRKVGFEETSMIILLRQLGVAEQEVIELTGLRAKREGLQRKPIRQEQSRLSVIGTVEEKTVTARVSPHILCTISVPNGIHGIGGHVLKFRKVRAGPAQIVRERRVFRRLA